MEACWKPGKSHRKLMRKTAESRTLGVSMASGSPRGGGVGREGRGAAGQRPGPGSSGGLGVRGAGSQPHKPRPCHAPSRPSPGGEGGKGRAGRGAEGGRRGRVVRAGGVGERGRCGPGWQGDAAPPRDARGVARRCAQSGPGAPGRGRRARPPGSEEARGIRSARGPLALFEARSLRSAPQALGLPQPPPLCWERAVPEEGSGGGAPQGQPGTGASAADCAPAPGGGIPSFLGPNLQASRSLPSRASPGPGKPRRAPGVGPCPEQPHSLGGVPLSTKTGRLFPTLEVRQRPQVFRVWMDAKSCCALLKAPASLLAVPNLF